MERAENITTDIKGCARCHGAGHAGITFTPLTYPFDCKLKTDGEWVDAHVTHWAPCPTNGEPIFYSTIKR